MEAVFVIKNVKALPGILESKLETCGWGRSTWKTSLYHDVIFVSLVLGHLLYRETKEPILILYVVDEVPVYRSSKKG